MARKTEYNSKNRTASWYIPCSNATILHKSRALTQLSLGVTPVPYFCPIFLSRTRTPLSPPPSIRRLVYLLSAFELLSPPNFFFALPLSEHTRKF